MASQSPTQPNYPPQGYEPAYKYENQFDQPIPRSYPDPLSAHYAAQSHQQEGQYTPEPQHLDGPAQWATQQGQIDSAVAQPSDTKARLRKACDSCSVRKVKVGSVFAATNVTKLTDLLSSVMKVVRHANLVQPSTFLAPSCVQVVVAAHLTNMLRLSRDSAPARMEHIPSQAAHLHTMRPIV